MKPSPTEDPSEAANAVEPSQDGVTVPEVFQKQVHALVKNAKRPHLAHMRDRISDRESELHKMETKGKRPAVYNSEDMPQD